MEHSLSPKWIKFPNWSPKTWISICFGNSINFSIKTLSSPKLDFASFTAELKFSFNSFSLKAILIPFPPPPAEALTINGKPIFFDSDKAFFKSLITSRPPGTTETPASFAIFLDSILSPIKEIAWLGGPIKIFPILLTSSLKATFSDKKPYPGWTASAFEFSTALIIFSIIR